ncbi:type IV pilin-like G/H family protein [Microcoleus sp. Pol10D4]|uniref:type IV pilin-like G/H family protein n=1 Tax=Microcoleus sp. Pol10D4 TaxID=3055387 RepID=UPI002FD495FB
MTNNKESIVRNAASRGCGCLLLIAGIGVMNGIALPFYLNNTNRSKQSEAKQYVGSMNKAQQAHFAEKSAFATSVNALEIGIKTETTNFKYSVRTTKKAGFNYGLSKEKDFKSYVGGVFLVPAKNFDPNAAKEEITTTFILCQADSPGTIKPAEPTYENGKIACGKGTKEWQN